MLLNIAGICTLLWPRKVSGEQEKAKTFRDLFTSAEVETLKK
jgi:hypothetical protein